MNIRIRRTRKRHKRPCMGTVDQMFSDGSGEGMNTWFTNWDTHSGQRSTRTILLWHSAVHQVSRRDKRCKRTIHIFVAWVVEVQLWSSSSLYFCVPSVTEDESVCNTICMYGFVCVCVCVSVCVCVCVPKHINCGRLSEEFWFSCDEDWIVYLVVFL